MARVFIRETTNDKREISAFVGARFINPGNICSWHAIGAILVRIAPRSPVGLPIFFAVSLVKQRTVQQEAIQSGCRHLDHVNAGIAEEVAVSGWRERALGVHLGTRKKRDRSAFQQAEKQLKQQRNKFLWKFEI